MTRPEHGTHDFDRPHPDAGWRVCAACGAPRLDVEDGLVTRDCQVVQRLVRSMARSADHDAP